MPRIVFLGPPGAGKGTQAKELARAFGIVHVSTGDLLRTAAREGTPLGLEVEQFLRAGQLVPDPLVLRLLEEQLVRPEAAAGYLLDGFPRTRPQAEALEALAPVDHVVYFEIPESLLVDRLTQRRSCPVCGSSYNLATNPPRVAGRCDRDGVSLIQRTDDQPEAVRTRLEVYYRQTAPLLDFYAQKGKLRRVDASADIPTVTRRIRAALGP